MFGCSSGEPLAGLSCRFEEKGRNDGGTFHSCNTILFGRAGPASNHQRRNLAPRLQIAPSVPSRYASRHMKGKRPSPQPDLFSTVQPLRPKPAEALPENAWALLLIDEKPIRRAMLKAYRACERKVARARDQIETFETQDLPAFTRWDAQIFGSLMTELRDVSALLEGKRHLLAVI